MMHDMKDLMPKILDDIAKKRKMSEALDHEHGLTVGEHGDSSDSRHTQNITETDSENYGCKERKQE